MNAVLRTVSASGLAIVAALAIAVFGASPAAATFGIAQTDLSFIKDGSPAVQAGSHPDSMTTEIVFNAEEDGKGLEYPAGDVKDLIVELPLGLVGVPTATPRCAGAEFADVVKGDDEIPRPSCNDDSAVGYVTLGVSWDPTPVGEPPVGGVEVYNLQPGPGSVAKFGFVVAAVPVTFDVKLSEEPPYRLVAAFRNVPQPLLVHYGKLTIWGDPTSPVHDPLRGSCFRGLAPDGSPESQGSCPTTIEGPALLTLPGSCEEPPKMEFAASSWQAPQSFVTASAETQDDEVPPNPLTLKECGALTFSPEVEGRISTSSADTGSGLDFEVAFDDEGLTDPDGVAQSTTRKAEVVLPEGVTVNPSVGENLGSCTPAQLAHETPDSAPGAGCPNASKIGTLHVETPLLEQSLEGSIFVAAPDDPATSQSGAENPFDSLIALYFVLKDPQLGIVVKLPAKVEPDPRSGRLVATLDDVPQLPFSRFRAHIRAGKRAPLVTPPRCGSYAARAVFTPWADPSRTVLTSTAFEISSGVGGSPCPADGPPPFSPGFEAGSSSNSAGSFSPFGMRLSRSDGEQGMTKLSVILPPGQLGSLAGVGRCPDVAVEIARSKSGRQERAVPSCPASSRIGRTVAGAGVGEELTYVGGELYLGGPYHGAPLSVIAITPAVAGPFDAGTVVIRLGLNLNPRTAQVEIDGAASDPIPHILKGIVLRVRDLRAYADRPNFTLNPTSCDEESVRATLFGSFLDVLSPHDDVPFSISARYQAANCLNLGFRPKLDFRLKGGTKRGGHPGFIADYRPRPGDANLERLAVRLPPSAFLDQSHIRTVCTRVQFAADSCPTASRYGHVRAWTPLLDEPLQGPVYLRSSDNPLPDLVFDLRGLVDIEVSAQIDSVRGGIRATLTNLPDAPISKVILRMQAGRKGLIVNSRDLCLARERNRANARFGGHNGKRRNSRLPMRAECGPRKREGSRGGPKRRTG